LPATGEVLARIRPEDPFPPVDRALRDPNGLLCAGGDLSTDRLLDAYRHGIFPWYSRGEPILWWSPDPRMVLRCADLKVSRSLAKSVRNKGYELRIDTCFEEVLTRCAVRAEGTWLGKDMKAAYLALHRAGHAHCFETWRENELVGGLYGVAIGRMFYGESMFSAATDASKVALVHLVSFLARRPRNPPARLCARNLRIGTLRRASGKMARAGEQEPCRDLTTCRTPYCSST
jgi:leucyl/phenylalanyl-tRNA--protein transferase